jgi:Lactate dehydrogenase and related dehydrogenases
MQLAVYSTKPHDRHFFDAANARAGHVLHYLEARLDRHTATLARGRTAVSLFVNDRADAAALAALADQGVRLVTLRSGGYNHVDLETARALGLTVTHVPDYSPHAVAEHTVALLLSLVRRIPQAYSRVREGNFSIEGLLGFDLHGKTAVLVGTGRVGLCVGRILQGFGVRVLAYDPRPSPAAREAGFAFGPLQNVLGEADIVTLHCPLLPTTRHLINRATLGWMKRGAVLLNTSRGGLLDGGAVFDALETGRLAALGIDVYEDEAALLYDDISGQGIRDEWLSRLIARPNVLVTGHQGFFTREALATIAAGTIGALDAFAAGRPCPHTLTAPGTSSAIVPPAAPHGSKSSFPVHTPPAVAVEHG